MWEAIKRDFRERFMNFETVKGIYMVPAGAALVYFAIFYIAYVIQLAFGLLGVYAVIEGLRKILVNRIKQAVVTDGLKNARLVAEKVEALIS